MDDSTDCVIEIANHLVLVCYYWLSVIILFVNVQVFLNLIGKEGLLTERT